MRGLMRTVLIAVAMLLSCDPARADRELFTFDCQGQVHIMAGTPVALSFRCSLFAGCCRVKKRKKRHVYDEEESYNHHKASLTHQNF